jgi:hypothetical protein
MAMAELTERALLLLGDLPPYLADDEHVTQRTVNAIAKELERIDTAAADLASLGFAQNATDEYNTLSILEDGAGLPVAQAGVSEEARRDAVLTAERSHHADSGADWVELMTLALGSGTSWSHEDDFAAYTVRIALPGTSGSLQAQQVMRFARLVTPAHLALNFLFEGGFILGEGEIGDVL